MLLVGISICQVVVQSTVSRRSTIADVSRRLTTPSVEAREAAKRTFSWPSVKRSLLVAIVVGTALNLINQGPEVLSGKWPTIWKLALTYLVPFLVASYGSYAAFKSSH